MIVMDGAQVKLGDAEERISRWEVWFHTPWGLCKDLYDAVEACKKYEIDPEAAIVPVPVAVTNSLYEAYAHG